MRRKDRNKTNASQTDRESRKRDEKMIKLEKQSTMEQLLGNQAIYYALLHGAAWRQMEKKKEKACV